MPWAWENKSISLFPLLVMVRGIEGNIKVCSEVTAQIFSLTWDTVPLGSCNAAITWHKVVRIQRSVLVLRIPCVLTYEIKGRNAEYGFPLPYGRFGASLVVFYFATFFLWWDPTLACKVLSDIVGSCDVRAVHEQHCSAWFPSQLKAEGLKLEFNFFQYFLAFHLNKEVD